MSETNQFRGAIHLHTNLSHDGTLTLEQLVEFLKSRKYHFMAITEHSYDIDQAMMADLAGRSAGLSSPGFIIIPGIEFRCHDDIDILGYGVIQVSDSDDPATIIKHIHDNGGVAVLAHPTIRNYPFAPDWIKLLDGCEIWNIQERKYLPRAETLRKFRQFKKWHPGLMAFCGLDLHRAATYYPVSTDIIAEENSRENILSAFSSGNFVSNSPMFHANSRGDLGIFQTLQVVIGGGILSIIKTVRNYLYDNLSI